MVPSRDRLSAWLAERFHARLLDCRQVHGGCIHRAWCLRLEDGGLLFAKTSSVAFQPLLEAEAEGLAALATVADGCDSADLVVPTPLARGLVVDQAILILPWLELEGGRQAAASDAWERLGVSLARFHRASLATAPALDPFGWPSDNFIGSTPQRNAPASSWARFFTDCRLAPQIARLGRAGAALPGGATLMEWLPELLDGHQPEPCLVHGDLWSGNASLLADGRGVIYDPAVYRGDREVDLAMANLFGGFPASFFRGYRETWPLPPGHQSRRDLYDLYHLLNHANLFGGDYLRQAVAVIERLLSRGTPPGRSAVC